MFTLFNLQGTLGALTAAHESELAHYNSARFNCQVLFSKLFNFILLRSALAVSLLIIPKDPLFVNKNSLKILHKPKPCFLRFLDKLFRVLEQKTGQLSPPRSICIPYDIIRHLRSGRSRRRFAYIRWQKHRQLPHHGMRRTHVRAGSSAGSPLPWSSASC